MHRGTRQESASLYPLVGQRRFVQLQQRRSINQSKTFMQYCISGEDKWTWHLSVLTLSWCFEKLHPGTGIVAQYEPWPATIGSQIRASSRPRRFLPVLLPANALGELLCPWVTHRWGLDKLLAPAQALWQFGGEPRDGRPLPWTTPFKWLNKSLFFVVFGMSFIYQVS